MFSPPSGAGWFLWLATELSNCTLRVSISSKSLFCVSLRAEEVRLSSIHALLISLNCASRSTRDERSDTTVSFCSAHCCLKEARSCLSVFTRVSLSTRRDRSDKSFSCAAATSRSIPANCSLKRSCSPSSCSRETDSFAEGDPQPSSNCAIRCFSSSISPSLARRSLCSMVGGLLSWPEARCCPSPCTSSSLSCSSSLAQKCLFSSSRDLLTWCRNAITLCCSDNVRSRTSLLFCGTPPAADSLRCRCLEERDVRGRDLTSWKYSATDCLYTCRDCLRERISTSAADGGC